MGRKFLLLIALASTWLSSCPGWAQLYDPPDRGEPGDAMIQNYLRDLAERVSSRWLSGVNSAGDWHRIRPRLTREYFYMLGLDPMPERTDLRAVVTKTLDRSDFTVEMLHFQSRSALYVTGNLYRPRNIKPGERLPAVLYLCGHWNAGRNGNKTPFQSFGIWFARHGYICLIIDTLQLGEIAATHHGTYKFERWWWQSRGYTPAGVECWNGIRSLDYLTGRPDVDPKRLAVTGASGGGAASFWVAAADEQVAVAIPCMGMADLESYVSNRTVNGHCDCMFLYNTFEWPWTNIAALVAPRPLLFVNSNQDPIFPMDANNRIANRLEQLYCLFGKGDMVDSVVSVGPHDYRKDIRQAVYRFINIHFKNDARVIADSEVDLTTSQNGTWKSLIPLNDLRVFPEDSDIPQDQQNTRIDEAFVPMAKVSPPAPGQFDAWKKKLLDELKRVSFRCLPERISAAKMLGEISPGHFRIETENLIEARLHVHRLPREKGKTHELILVVTDPANEQAPLDWLDPMTNDNDTIYVVDPRGVGETRWTRKNPPNYVERAHALLGRTVDVGRVWDVIAAARWIMDGQTNITGIHAAGRGAGGFLAAYAALFEPAITAVTLVDPPPSHMALKAPAILNVLRVCDVPEVLGMLAPRRLTIQGAPADALDRAAAIYRAAGASDRISAARAESRKR